MTQTNQIILRIEGMSCSMCKGKVEKALKSISGVINVSVDLETKEAIIGGLANPAALVKAVEEIGFKVKN
ncbi:heavy-metal-associated domain-containing protein [Sporomusa sp. KB1]|jgi:copper chaperone CopZ|uniref:heavy-metal-associated domain-containing protein n=1 Tax=Sporomusa sp. KB1 TaxID=943346 RepID=UPI00119CA261|nr:heavy metal-associated domain-containing protein [Sporomusa sp. KB1]TWH48395.1 Cu+-exporting ATPase/Au+-exporting ATPase [Sporomusa sp. KB1]